MSLPPKEYFLPFLKKEQQAKETISFFFDASQANITFTAGHYIRMFLNPSQDDPRGNYRSFSICSAPEQKDILMITTKIFSSSSLFKQKLMSLNPGEVVRFFGPMGTFLLPEKAKESLVFLAGGIGITPFHSMLLHAAASNYQTLITLLVSFTTVEEAAFYEELTKLSTEYSYIKVVYTITQPEKSQKEWRGETGRISAELIRKYSPNTTESNYFVCGPSPMVATMLDLLQDLKVPPERIREEQFTGY